MQTLQPLSPVTLPSPRPSTGPTVKQLASRQVHLDFHTSPYIPEVGIDFDPDDFARTMAEAKVNSVTVFAKCHHGMSYYPTRVGKMHPSLKGRDLLGEMIEALHRRDIRCPIYTTVVWEEHAADTHPEWRQMRSNGTFAQYIPARNNGKIYPGGWRFLNFAHPDYQDYIDAHLDELIANYPMDGIFFDILFFDQDTCWSDASVKLREKFNLMGRDEATRLKFESLAQNQFTARFSRKISSHFPDATINYNALSAFTDSSLGVRARAKSQTHWELESLPSGVWGYHHFPRLGRYLRTWNQPWLGMTGRFQKSWGDFGGVKPVAALEYECFRSQAHGGGASVGDQLPPRGRLDKTAYQLIGTVYRKCEAAESFYENSAPCPELGIFLAATPQVPSYDSSRSEEGVVMMCEEIHYDADMLDDESSLDKYPLLILPDFVEITTKLATKLRKYYQNGGKLLLSYKSGFDAQGNWMLDFLPLTFHGKCPFYPTYWRSRDTFSPIHAGTDRVVYQQGLQVTGAANHEVLIDRVFPCFQRTDLHFCSHLHAPPVQLPNAYPAAIAGERFIYFADPIHLEYRQSGNIPVRDLFSEAVRKLIGTPKFGNGLPKSVLIVPRKKKDSLLLTLLHYIPARKSIEIDIIEDPLSFAGLKLRLPENAKEAVIYPDNTPLEKNSDGTFNLPAKFGRLLIEVKNFFRERK